MSRLPMSKADNRLAESPRAACVATPDDARKLAIVKQGLDRIPGGTSKRDVLEVLKKIKLVQVDAIHVVERSQYLVVLSRLGPYNKNLLDELLFPDGRLFEQWSHADCYIPTDFYSLFRPEIITRRRRPMRYGKLAGLGQDPKGTLASVLAVVTKRGPSSTASFDDPDRGKNRRAWWNRKPARVALEVLWYEGYLAVQRREKSLIYYDLANRVLPDGAAARTHPDFRIWAVKSALDALGIGTAADICDYFRQDLAETRVILEKLIQRGTVVQMAIEGWDTAYILSQNLDLLREIQMGHRSFARTTLLSPFDNLIWNRNRMERLFGISFRSEMYLPKEKRTLGYYSMPILHRDKIVGMVDPKVDRKRRVLVMNSIHLEKGFNVTAGFRRGFSHALKDFKQFNECDSMWLPKTLPRGLEPTMRSGALHTEADGD